MRDSSFVCVRFGVQPQKRCSFNAGDVLLMAHKNDAASVWSKISGEVRKRPNKHKTKESEPGTLHNGIIGIVMKKFPRRCLIKVTLSINQLRCSIKSCFYDHHAGFSGLELTENDFRSCIDAGELVAQI